MTDSFELTLSNPLTQEEWDKLTDVELEKTKKMWFETPSGKKVEFIPLSVLNDIKAEIEAVTRFGIAYHPIEHGVLMDIIDRHIGKEKEDAETG